LAYYFIMKSIYLIFFIALVIKCTSCKENGSTAKNTDVEEVKLKNDVQNILVVESRNTDSALLLFKAGLQKSTTDNFDKGKNKYYNHIVYNLCIYQNEFLEGYRTANEQLEFAKTTNQNKFLTDANSSIALTFITRDLTDSAAYYYLNAIDYASKAKDSASLINIYRNIIKVYLLQGYFKKALQYSLTSLHYAASKKDTSDLASIHNNISIIYKGLNDNIQWQKHIDTAFSYINCVKLPSLKLAIINSKASSFMENKKYDSAQSFFQQAKLYSEKLQDSFHLLQAQINMAYCKLKIGKTTEALSDLNIADKLAKNITIPLEKAKEFEAVKFDIFKAAGLLDKALKAKENYALFSDSLYKINSSKIYSETEIKIKEANFDKKISDNELKITKRNNIIAILCISILSLSIIGLLFYFNQKRKRILQENNISLLKKENELTTKNAALEAQLEERNRISREIHDELGASLTSIALTTDLLRTKLKDKTEEVDKISNTSSAMVDSLNEIIWSLSSGNDSFKSLMAYTRKMFINLLEDTTIKHQFYTPILENDFSISGSARRAIYLTIKEALNNAIKHSKATTINLSYAIEDTFFILLIEDNGKGIIEKNEFGNGLINMKKNIEKIGGRFSILNNNGTTIKISYPLKQQ
jgi:signal transduction histidine kinase